LPHRSPRLRRRRRHRQRPRRAGEGAPAGRLGGPPGLAPPPDPVMPSPAHPATSASRADAPTLAPDGALARPRVLVTERIDESGLALLRPHLDVDVRLGLGAEALRAAVATADALIVRSQTRVTAALLAAAPRLQVIARAGAGVDNIDLAAATERGILVVNAPGGNAVAAAEHTIGLLFALARGIPAADAALKRGEWRRDSLVGVEVAGKTLGLV